MKISLSHVPHISNKIVVDLLASKLVVMTRGVDLVMVEATKVLEANIKQEQELEEKVKDIIYENEEEIDFYQADDRQLFFMIKKKLAPEFGVILSYEDRYSDIAHKILDAIYEEDLMAYDIDEGRLKNIIYNAITSFISTNEEIQDAVYEKMRLFKDKFSPGTDEYEIRFEKLYREELNRRGLSS